MKIKNIFIFLVLFITISLQSFAQNNTLYFMDRLPQNNMLNPAFHLNNKLYIGFPGISSFGFKYSNSGFNFNDISFLDPDDTLVFSLNKAAENIKKNNFINNEAFVQILTFGFKAKDLYFNFSINNKTNTRIQFPSSILDIRHGNYDPITKETLPIDLSNLKLSGDNYTEIAFGASKELSSNLTVGATAKLLMGTGSVKSKKTDLLLTTQLDENGQVESLTADVDFDIRSASVPYEVFYNDKGIIDSVFVDEDRITNDYMKLFVFNGSWGMAFDFGATYNLTSEIQLSASLLDLGWIRWKESTKQLRSTGSFTFKGLELVPDADGNINIDSIATQLTDSIIQSLEISDISSPYSTATIPKILIGGNYSLTDHIKVGALLRADLYAKGIRLSSSFSATASFGKRWQVSTSYSFMHHAYNNLGLGLSMNAGFFNFYMITDNIPIRMGELTDNGNFVGLVPMYAQTLNLRLGFNFLFGYKTKKIDKPSIETDDILLLKK